MKIKDILTIDLSEDIKNVIDLEDISELEIKTEIDHYIVTDGLAGSYSEFLRIYTSNIRETGVWISGFYGSGKSYFGKLLGYLLSNRIIAGTPARQRILQRFTGITDEELVKNSIFGLDAVSSKVIFLDVAKQDTSKGLAFTLFKGFLRSEGFPDNEHGVFLYKLMVSEGKTDIKEFVSTWIKKDWATLRDNTFKYAPAIREIYIASGKTDADYQNLITSVRREIDQFSAARLKAELENYLAIKKNEKIVFMFDETSEAISQQKFSLLDLEGVSEALSSLGGKVWTIAIAQEKLDDVINNSNVDRAQLTKVTDRFKTKIHLEATEVDVIIRNRLLRKNEKGLKQLAEYYAKNSGKIADHASLHGAGVSKTDSKESYATYFPFYKYQFDLLQNFLFGTKGYASTKVAARGMIITTYDILRQEVQHTDLFHTVTGWHIAKEGQPQPPVRLVSRYTNAERSLAEAKSPVNGRRLLETINFLTEAEITPPTLPNITRSFISDPDQFHKTQEQILKALDILVDAKILLENNKTYRITSDIEQRLLDEMNGFTVQSFAKKKQLTTAYKSSEMVKSSARVSDNGLQYDFYITTDNDDELTPAKQKYLQIKIKSIYNFSDDRSADISALRARHQNDKDLLWLVPDNASFREIDRLIDEAERISYLEQKYSNPQSEEGRILMSFSAAKEEKLRRVTDLVNAALQNSTIIYMYNLTEINPSACLSELQKQQKQMIGNVYSKRLSSQLNDTIAASVIKETNNSRLHQYFNGSDFLFFDAQGSFTGANLKVTEEIIFKIRNTFVDGAALETELEKPPAGYTFGTVISSVAALMRGGKIIARHNGTDKFSWRDNGTADIFSSAREFRKASFKAVSKSLSLAQKQELAETIMNLNPEFYTDRHIDYNTSDFDLVNTIRDISVKLADRTDVLGKNVKEFGRLFPAAVKSGSFLGGLAGAVSEANYIDKAEEFLKIKDEFSAAVSEIEKTDKFVADRFPKVHEWKLFADAVNDELTKSAAASPDIQKQLGEFALLLSGDVVANFAQLQQAAQKIKDEYHRIFSGAMKTCADGYSQLAAIAENLIAEIHSLPDGLNSSAKEKAEALARFAQHRKNPVVSLGFDVKDQQSRFTYSEVLSFIELLPGKKTEAEIIRAGLVREKLPEPAAGNQTAPAVKKFRIRVPSGSMKVSDYRNWLQGELHKIAGASDNDEVEINS